jgi:hypothetical protein
MNGPRKIAGELLIGISALCLLGGFVVAEEPVHAQIEQVQRIWNLAPHNAFTDLIRDPVGNRWLCVFREGQNHVSADGALRVLSSTNGGVWKSIALVQMHGTDLRDPKIVQAPNGKMMLTGAAAYPSDNPVRHQTFAWVSTDGAHWDAPSPIGDPNLWLWRVTWDRGTAWSVGYDTSGERFVRLYKSEDGRNFSSHVATLFDHQSPNEHSLIFLPDRTALCLLRRDGSPGNAMLGKARPPYLEWAWTDVGRKLGGPHMLRIADGRILVGARLYDGTVRTSLLSMDPDKGTLVEWLKLPSGGDTSYPGLAWHEDRLWMSYYSSHEGKASIYFARIRLM